MVSNLSKVPENRLTLLKELVSVAKSLGAVSTHDLQLLGQQLDVAKRDAVARVRASQSSRLDTKIESFFFFCVVLYVIRYGTFCVCFFVCSGLLRWLSRYTPHPSFRLEKTSEDTSDRRLCVVVYPCPQITMACLKNISAKHRHGLTTCCLVVAATNRCLSRCVVPNQSNRSNRSHHIDSHRLYL